ncbi:MAG TPA: threonine/serine exporter family protein [Lachnospiraceae bacterium]|nr:threonine/serine exporter family protein [Lachnospiraceae bacterium]
MKENPAQLLSAILDVGETMLISGAEVNRVENTIQHMAVAYGFSKVNVFAITSSIVVTVYEPEGNIYTQTRRIKVFETDMYKVERCNSLSRAVCKEPLCLKELMDQIDEMKNQKGYSEIVTLCIYGFVAAVFTGFFGGSVRDMVAALICGLTLRLILWTGRKLKVQNIILTIFCSAVIAFVTLLLVKAGLGESTDKIIIGNIMLLIPGMSLTTSLRDMINGDLISGLLGLCEAVIRAVAIAGGVALVLWQMGGGL